MKCERCGTENATVNDNNIVDEALCQDCLDTVSENAYSAQCAGWNEPSGIERLRQELREAISLKR